MDNTPTDDRVTRQESGQHPTLVSLLNTASAPCPPPPQASITKPVVLRSSTMVTLRISARNISGHRGRKRQGRDMQNRVRRVPHSDMVLCMAGGGGYLQACERGGGEHNETPGCLRGWIRRNSKAACEPPMAPAIARAVPGNTRSVAWTTHGQRLGDYWNGSMQRIDSRTPRGRKCNAQY